MYACAGVAIMQLAVLQDSGFHTKPPCRPAAHRANVCLCRVSRYSQRGAAEVTGRLRDLVAGDMSRYLSFPLGRSSESSLLLSPEHDG